MPSVKSSSAVLTELPSKGSHTKCSEDLRVGVAVSMNQKTTVSFSRSNHNCVRMVHL